MEQKFIIKSLFIQNSIMLIVLGLVVVLLVSAIRKKNIRQVIAWGLWVLIVLWFFNSRFFGFSAVGVNPDGIHIDYGILSVRNTVLPVDSPWKVEKYMGGIRRIRTLYYIQIGEHQSMKVRGRTDYELLTAIGAAIDGERPG